jgi:hypothetical protein
LPLPKKVWSLHDDDDSSGSGSGSGSGGGGGGGGSNMNALSMLLVTYFRIQNGHCVRACNVQHKGRGTFNISRQVSACSDHVDSKTGLCAICELLGTSRNRGSRYTVHAGLNTVLDAYCANFIASVV